jgi:hypothetical protein
MLFFFGVFGIAVPAHGNHIDYTYDRGFSYEEETSPSPPPPSPQSPGGCVGDFFSNTPGVDLCPSVFGNLEVAGNALRTSAAATGRGCPTSPSSLAMTGRSTPEARSLSPFSKLSWGTSL